MLTNLTAPTSICILRLSAIGDVCHAVATVQAIQKKHPQAKITWVIGKIEAMLLQSLANVEFIVFDKKAGLKGYYALYNKLKGRRFDLLLHMQVAVRASLATLCIRAKEKWGFDKDRAKEGQWLFTNRQISAQTQPHVADGFWGFAVAIGVPATSRPIWKMPLTDESLSWSRQQTNNKPFVVISPAASKPERNWLSERYAALADHAFEKGFTVVLSGGVTPQEKTLGKQILQFANSPIINLIGKTSLSQLLALLADAQLVIAPDSGPAHMATTVNTPVVGLYAHSNPKRTGPYHSLKTTVSVYEQLLLQQTGKSSEDNPWGKRVKGDGLMELISVESVIETFDQCLK